MLQRLFGLVLLFTPVAAWAQERAVVTTPAVEHASQPAGSTSRFARGWIDVNLGLAVPAESSYGAIYHPRIFGETATFTADYHSPRGAEFDFGGGVMLTPAFGLGVSFAGTAHEDNAMLGIRIPHPRFVNAYATDASPTDEKLMRSEGSVNIQALFVGQLSNRVTARIFAGPSYFRVKQDAVGDITYDHDYLLLLPVHEVEITSYVPATIDLEDGGGWGFTPAATSTCSSRASLAWAGSRGTVAAPSPHSNRCRARTRSPRLAAFSRVEGCACDSESTQTPNWRR